jgi:hypothetical protein
MAYYDGGTAPPPAPIPTQQAPLALPAPKAEQPPALARLSSQASQATDGTTAPRKTMSAADIRQQQTMDKLGNGTVFARIAYNPRFENTTMLVIVFNAVWIGVDTDMNHENLRENDKLPLEPLSTVVENLFCFYFTFEVAVRFLAYKKKTMGCFDAWFIFDSILVSCMILETWIMAIVELASSDSGGGGVGALSALRLLRLLRLARMGRLMRFVPEMLKLVKGMIAAARSVIFILIFLVMVIYVFAIVFTGAIADSEATPICTPEQAEDDTVTGCIKCDLIGNPVPGMTERQTAAYCAFDGDRSDPSGEELDTVAKDLFGTMGDSFMSLLTRGVLGDNLAETCDVIQGADPTAPFSGQILFWLFVVFLLITFATLLNMLIGVVCDVISEAAQSEEEVQTLNMLKLTIEDAFHHIDANADGRVTIDEWQEIKNIPTVRKSFEGLGIEEERMDERLEQMSAMIFPGYKLPDPSRVSQWSGDGVRSQMTSFAKTKSEKEKNDGLTVEELIKKVIEIRPDQHASALDLEMLKAQVGKDQKLYQKKLKRIEEGVKKALGPKCNIDDDDVPLPTMPTGMDPLAEMLGTDIRLEEVPTELLLQALKQRAPSDEMAIVQHPNAPPIMNQYR